MCTAGTAGGTVQYTTGAPASLHSYRELTGRPHFIQSIAHAFI